MDTSSYKAPVITHAYGQSITPKKLPALSPQSFMPPTIAERIKFYNARFFSPTLSTLAQTISAGFLTIFSAFITKQLRKYSQCH